MYARSRAFPATFLLAFLLRAPIPLSSLRAFENDGSTKDHSHKSMLAYNREYLDLKIIIRKHRVK